MSDTITVQEMMVPVAEYPTIHDEDNLKDAIITLTNYLKKSKEHRALLVFSKTRKVEGEEELLGILKVADILNTVKRNSIKFDNVDFTATSWECFFDKATLEKCTTTTVGKIIRRPLVKTYIQYNENLSTAIKLMMNKNSSILPVFKGKKVVGVIKSIEILNYIGRILMNMAPSPTVVLEKSL